MTTQTNGHVEASDLRRPFSHTGPDDTTGNKEFTSEKEKKEEGQPGEESRTQAH